MDFNTELDFFRKLLKGLNISSCIVEDSARSIPPHIDLGLRQTLFHQDNYVQYLENDFVQAQPDTIYCYFDEYDCKYIFFQLPGKTQPSYFFIGPYLLQMPVRQWLQQRSNILGLRPEQQQFMELYYTALPILEDENILLTMTNTLASTLWQDKPYTMEYIQYAITDRRKPISTDSAARNVNDPELNLSALERNYASENQLMEAVSKGSVHRMTAAATVLNMGAPPRLSDSLRDRKNNLIILKTLLRKSAEKGGVHPLHLHRISSQFADKIEAVRTVKQSLRLQEDMMRSFCLLVKHHSLNKYSYYVGQVIILVQYDLTADLSLNTIAKKLNVNASYLSNLFHREYGCTLTNFINKERIQHGIRLLSSTNRPVQQIASECGIPNTNYFIKLFKAQTGLTPNQYRLRG